MNDPSPSTTPLAIAGTLLIVGAAIASIIFPQTGIWILGSVVLILAMVMNRLRRKK